MSNLRKWADEQQFVAEPMQAERSEGGVIVPSVKLLWMTPDPLGANAAMGRMYRGIPTYNLADITDEERLSYWNDSLATHLRAPLESIKMHFFEEGVTRSYTHQMVRQRTAVYAQESMRFAVKEDMAAEASLPPSLAELSAHHPTRQVWDEALAKVSDAYNFLIANGIPAEDARGLAPHCTTTRINYVTDMRNLAEHAGNRLCTQAQFEWRAVFMGIVQAIRNYTPDFSWVVTGADVEYGEADDAVQSAVSMWEWKHRWQFETIANSALFRPICYQLGRCPFNASFDRTCKIKKRVDVRTRNGSRDTEKWDRPFLGDKDPIQGGLGADYRDDGIHFSEWLMDPAAARLTAQQGREA